MITFRIAGFGEERISSSVLLNDTEEKMRATDDVCGNTLD